MGTPIILPFKPTDGGNSLTSLNSLIVGAGVVWGKVSVPLTPLIFSRENISRNFGGGSSLLRNLPVDNKDFFENHYNGLPSGTQEGFQGTTKEWNKNDVGGVAIGFAPGGVLKEAGKQIAQLAVKTVLRKIVHKLFSTVSLDALQSSQSLRAQLHGMNGRDTYNLEIEEIAASKNVFIVQGAAGIIAGIGLNLMFIGDFGTWFTGKTQDPIYGAATHLWSVYQRSKAFAIIGDGAIGAILPNVQISLITS